MNFAEPFIRGPVATTLLVLAILIFGIMGYALLPVSDLPTVDFPTIQVQANLPGASPETMAAVGGDAAREAVLDDCRRTSISSSNGQGNTNITLQFDLSRNIDAAAQDVQSMIARDRAAAAAGHAVAAVVPEGQSGRHAGAVPHAELADAAALADRPLRRDGARAAALDGQRRRAGQRVRRAEVRRPHRRRPDAARARADRHRSGGAGDHRRRTSTGPPARSTGRSATSSWRRAAS